MARALAWHARGRRFDPDTLHKIKSPEKGCLIMFHRICVCLFFDSKCPFTSKLGHKWVTKIPKETLALLITKVESGLDGGTNQSDTL